MWVSFKNETDGRWWWVELGLPTNGEGFARVGRSKGSSYVPGTGQGGFAKWRNNSTMLLLETDAPELFAKARSAFAPRWRDSNGRAFLPPTDSDRSYLRYRFTEAGYANMQRVAREIAAFAVGVNEADSTAQERREQEAREDGQRAGDAKRENDKQTGGQVPDEAPSSRRRWLVGGVAALALGVLALALVRR